MSSLLRGIFFLTLNHDCLRRQLYLHLIVLSVNYLCLYFPFNFKTERILRYIVPILKTSVREYGDFNELSAAT